MPSFPLPSSLPILVGSATIFGLFLYLFVSLKIEVWRLKFRFAREVQSFEASCRTLEERIAGMQETLREAETRAAVLVPPRSSRSGMNINKRIQAARLAKRGERPEQIAAALGLPRSEIALLLKVQRMTLQC